VTAQTTVDTQLSQHAGQTLPNGLRLFTYLSLEDAARMYEWLDRVGFAVDRAAFHREFPDVAFHDCESWAKTQDWNALLQSA
jgi:hypothetical protein